MDHVCVPLANGECIHCLREKLAAIETSRDFWREKYSEQCALYHDAAKERNASRKEIERLKVTLAAVAGDPLTEEQATAVLREAGISEADAAASFDRLQENISTLDRVMRERDELLAECAALRDVASVEQMETLPARAKALLAVVGAARRIATYNCGYGDPGECADALNGDESSVDRPCAACVAKVAMAALDAAGSGKE